MSTDTGDPRNHPMPTWACPWCGHVVSAAGEFDKPVRAPRPGDFAVCIDCAKPCVYTEALRLRQMTHEEADSLSQDESNDLLRGIRRIQAMHEQVGRPSERKGKS